jgi:hypothetical protein
MGKTGMAISYAFNKTFITKEFCVNKAKPEMKCNGKCYLKKQLAQQEEKQNNNPVSFEKLPDIFWAANTFDFSQQLFPVTIHQFSNSPILQFSNFPNSFFHPPSAV